MLQISMLKKSNTILVLGIVLVLLISYFQYENWSLVHQENMQALISATYGVVDGTPHWRAYQNRILSPFLIYGLGYISDQPFQLFMKFSFFALNIALFTLVVRLTESVGRALLAVQGAAIFWIFQHHYWSYSWDMVEGASILLLTYYVLLNEFDIWVALLIGASIFNKETSVFIGVYFMMRGIIAKHTRGAMELNSIRVGLALSITALAITEGLRHLLFKISSMEEIGQDLSHSYFGNHFNVANNWDLLMGYMGRPTPFFMIIVFYVMALCAFMSKAIVSRHTNMIALAGTFCLYGMALLLCGLLDEYRIYQSLMWGIAMLIACADKWPSDERGPQTPAMPHSTV